MKDNLEPVYSSSPTQPGPAPSWFVYILVCADRTLYTGITNDIEKRFKAHISGKGSKYTRGRGVKTCVPISKHSNRSEASTREREIKKLNRDEKLALICKTGI